jgi:hypothetical protein
MSLTIYFSLVFASTLSTHVVHMLEYTRLLKAILYYGLLQSYSKLGNFPLRAKLLPYLLKTQALKILTEQTHVLDRKNRSQIQ